MRIITQKRINDAKTAYPEAATALDHWYKTMKLGCYRGFSELRLSFGSK